MKATWCRFLLSLWVLCSTASLESTQQYYCTGANAYFYPMVLNLIGSIHANNYDNLNGIAVFDLGMNDEMINHLNSISKVKVYQMDDKTPWLLTTFHQIGGRQVLGYYGWKPAIIKQISQVFPYFLWIDAGSTVLKPLDDLFDHIDTNGYFLSTWAGYATWNGEIIYHSPLIRHTTSFVKEQFNLTDPKLSWILDRPSLDAGLMGIKSSVLSNQIDNWYQCTSDIRYFIEDGTCPEGAGFARHDQTLISILAYKEGLDVYLRDMFQKTPMNLVLKSGELSPFYIVESWDRSYISDPPFDPLYNELTCIYRSRGDMRKYDYFISSIIISD